METFEGKLEKMTPENLEGMLRTTDFLLNFSWLEKIPGMKDRAQEITHYMPLIQ